MQINGWMQAAGIGTAAKHHRPGVMDTPLAAYQPQNNG